LLRFQNQTLLRISKTTGGCKPLPTQEGLVEVFDYNDSLVQFTCPHKGHYNELASLYFNPWDHALRLLFHLPMVRVLP
jgi:hypothetical protein